MIDIVLEVLIIAFLLSLIGVDDAIISGLSELLGREIQTSGYYLFMLIVGIFAAILFRKRER